MPTTRPPSTNPHPGSAQGKTSALPDRLLKAGSTTATSASPSIAAASVTSIASPMNCATRCLRPAPTTLRTPTSRARSTDRAVVRLIKLMQAMSSKKTAMAATIRT